MLQGEKGTGKSTVAEILHANSNPPEAPLVRIDCSLSSESDFKTGLLGAGGAGGTWVQEAHNGTLFLDHIQCLPASIQPDLVSVLRNTTSSFRLVCSSSEDLEKLTDEGQFHDELFYRVASLPVHLPPLRQRLEDIPQLVRHFVSKAANPLFDSNLVEFTDDALAVFNAYYWPGNLSELCQVVSKIASTSETRVVTSQQLPMRLREVKHWPKLSEFLAGQRKQYVDMVLHACQGDRVKAAAVLGVAESELG